jgi:hypothetical protein
MLRQETWSFTKRPGRFDILENENFMSEEPNMNHDRLFEAGTVSSVIPTLSAKSSASCGWKFSRQPDGHRGSTMTTDVLETSVFE